MNIVADRKRYEEIVAVEARHQATLLADQLGRRLESVDRASMVIAERIRSNGVEFYESPEGRQDLRDVAYAMPLDCFMWVFAPDGTPIATTISETAPTVDVSDRDYFRQAIAKKGEPVIGSPIQGKIFNGEIVPIARSVHDGQGQVVAVVLIALKLRSVMESYRSFLGGGLNVIAVQFSGDGRFLMRLPDAERREVKFTDRPPFSDMVEQDEGSFTDFSPVDQQERTIGFKRVEAFPLVAVAGVHTKSWAGRWRYEVLWQALWLFVGIILSFILYRTVLHRVRADHQHAVSLEAADRAKSHFLAAASHDLRQPIQAMRLFWEVLAANEKTSAHPAIAPLGETIGIVEELLNSLLQVSALESGVIKPKISPVQLGELIGHVCGPLGRKAEEKSLSITTVPSSLTIESDPALLGQMLANLVGNAIKYTATGRVLVGCRRRNGNIFLEVHDTGTGIPAGKTEEIFCEFVQLGNPERDRTKGLGLGLSIVRKTAAMLGYDIDVRSTEGRGSCFAIIIPWMGAGTSRSLTG